MEVRMRKVLLMIRWTARYNLISLTIVMLFQGGGFPLRRVYLIM